LDNLIKSASTLQKVAKPHPQRKKAFWQVAQLSYWQTNVHSSFRSHLSPVAEAQVPLWREGCGLSIAERRLRTQGMKAAAKRRECHSSCSSQFLSSINSFLITPDLGKAHRKTSLKTFIHNKANIRHDWLPFIIGMSENRMPVRCIEPSQFV
jgi:hypothetical protein